MRLRKSCEDCPLVQNSHQIADDNRTRAECWEKQIVEDPEQSARLERHLAELQLTLNERVAELTYDSVSRMDDETREKMQEELKESRRTGEEFDRIVFASKQADRVELIKGVQTALRRMADGSEVYTAELQARCRKGPGRLLLPRLVYCRSGDESPNLTSFFDTERYQELSAELNQAYEALNNDSAA